MDQFDGVHGPLHVLRINVDQHHIGAHILNLAQDRVGRAGGKPHVAKDIPAHLRALQPLLEDREPFFVLGKEGNRYAMHGWNLNYRTRNVHVMKRTESRQVTFVTEFRADSSLQDTDKFPKNQ